MVQTVGLLIEVIFGTLVKLDTKIVVVNGEDGSEREIHSLEFDEENNQLDIII